MEYISGRDMSRIVPKAQANGIPFPMVYALKVAANVCDGLNYAHTKTDAYGNPLHIVHRDVTPENCLVGFNGTVKLVDFGIAKANTQLEETQAGELKGKLSYMSPEQAMGEPWTIVQTSFRWAQLHMNGSLVRACSRVRMRWRFLKKLWTVASTDPPISTKTFLSRWKRF